MKNFCILSILLFSCLSVLCQTQITLTFQAKDSLTQNPMSLDSVNIKNLTENCDTTLYDSVSVLALNASWPVSIDENDYRYSGALTLLQNNPNPFNGTTSVKVCLVKSSNLSFELYDSQGEKLAEFKSEFEKGWHQLAISSGRPGIVFLKGNDGTTTRMIKMLCTVNSDKTNGISYIGKSVPGLKMDISSTSSGLFRFYLGNQLQYTAYSSGYKENIVFDNPVSSETYSFNMAIAAFTCGSSLTINHVAGVVAPVNKTVTYGTVSNVPGATTKCWITSNLGADHQATSVSDNTEASAGWYWQFNHKQGYKHDGFVRTPNTVWIDYINENSDWDLPNDPCAIELGEGWRVPTFSEWTNVDAAGNWTTWNGPWNSLLKMHASGQLFEVNGSLTGRGSSGEFSSSTQADNESSWYLWFESTSCVLPPNYKAVGRTLRCLKD